MFPYRRPALWNMQSVERLSMVTKRTPCSCELWGNAKQSNRSMFVLTIKLTRNTEDVDPSPSPLIAAHLLCPPVLTPHRWARRRGAESHARTMGAPPAWSRKHCDASVYLSEQLVHHPSTEGEPIQNHAHQQHHRHPGSSHDQRHNVSFPDWSRPDHMTPPEEREHDKS